MKKGVTPVVATVLLISITMGAAGTLYAIVQGNIDSQTQNGGEVGVGLTTDSLKLEKCYLESDDAHIVMRNNGQEAINASELNLILNGAIRDFNSNNGVTNPQGTFTLEIDDKIGSQTDIILTNGDENKEFNCIGLPNGKPIRIISIGWNARQSEGGTAPIPPDGDESSWGGIYNAYDDDNILPGTRSYGVAAFNRTTESFIWTRQYDIYDSGDSDGDGTENGVEEAGRLADDLNALPDKEEVVVIVATADEPQQHRKSNGLESAMYSIGASENVYGSSNSGSAPFKYRSAYALVGSPNLTKGEAYLERYQGDQDRDKDAWIDVTYEIETS